MRVKSATVVFVTIAACSGTTAGRGAGLADGPPRVRVEFRRAQDEAAPGYSKKRIEGTQDTVYVHDKADFVLTPDDVREAFVDKDERKRPDVVIVFAEPGRKKMGALTGDQVGKRLAILADGKVVSAPTLRTKITDTAMISGELTLAEAERLARGLGGK